MKAKTNLVRPRWNKVLADLWDNKTRTLLVVASIAVGVFAVGTIANAYLILAEDIDASYAAVNPDENLDIPAYAHLLERAVKDIVPAQNRVRYAINGFVIAIGSYISDLTPKAISAAESIGVVEVEMNGTACKVPLATDYIQKVIYKDRVGKKRKTARC